MNLKSYFPCFLVLCFIAVMHFMAIKNEWYFYYRYTDTLLHFLAGFVVGYTTWWFYMGFQKKEHKLPPSVILGLMILTTMIVGLFWEYFEYTFDIAYSNFASYTVDTVHDICMDLIGSIVAGILLVLFKAPGFKHKDLVK